MSEFEGKRCCKLLYGGHSYRGRNCSKPVRVEIKGKFYCAIHDPVFIKAKDDEAEAKFRQKMDMQKRAAKETRDRAEFSKFCISAIREIAAGHNDAQSLAQSVLESEPKP